MVNKFNGYNSSCVTVTDAGAQVGSFVKIDNGVARLASANDSIVGMCVSKRNGVAGVQTHGYISCSYSGSPRYGVCSLVVANGDSVKPADFAVGGRAAIVVEIDEENHKIGFILC